MEEQGIQSFEFEEVQSDRHVINSLVSYVDTNGVRTVWLGWQPLLSYPLDDEISERFIVVFLARQKAATLADLAQGFGIHVNTVRRWLLRFEAKRVDGLMGEKRGPKGPRKLTPAIERDLQAWFRSGRPIGKALVADIEARYGIRLDPDYLRRLCKEKQSAPLLAPAPMRPAQQLAWALEPCQADAESDVADPVESRVSGGDNQPALLQVSAITASADADVIEPQTTTHDSTPQPPSNQLEPISLPSDHEHLAALRGGVHTPYAGAWLVVPFLQQLGLQSLVTGLLGQLAQSRWFNTWEVWLTGLFMSLLGYHSWESFKTVSRRLWGVLVGRRRGPTAQTLRAKVAALAAGSVGGQLVEALARRFMEAGRVATGVLYYDGHFRPYYGPKKLAKGYYTQRRMPVPGSSSYFANDGKGRPLFFLLVAANYSLNRMLPTLIAKTREIIGGQLLTVVFDRGGYSATVFTALEGLKILFITYAAKLQVELPAAAFTSIPVRYRYRTVQYGVWEGTHTVKDFGELRLVVVKKGSKQTPILTNDRTRPAAEVVELLLNRWSQENFFKTMVHEYGLNVVGAYETELPDQQVRVPNPAHRALTKTLREMAKEQKRVAQDLGKAYTHTGQNGPASDLARQLIELETRRKDLLKQRRSLPATVAASEVEELTHVLRFERRMLHDAMRVCAYTLNEALLEQFARYYDNWHDIRQVLRSLVRSKGFVRLEDGILLIRLAAPEVPRYSQAFRRLCADLNRMNPVTPDRFQLPIRFTLD